MTEQTAAIALLDFVRNMMVFSGVLAGFSFAALVQFTVADRWSNLTSGAAVAFVLASLGFVGSLLLLFDAQSGIALAQTIEPALITRAFLAERLHAIDVGFQLWGVGLLLLLLGVVLAAMTRGRMAGLTAGVAAVALFWLVGNYRLVQPPQHSVLPGISQWARDSAAARP